MKPKLALLGGSPVCDATAWPRWPVWDACEAEALQAVLESGQWQSGPRVAAFETTFAHYQGAEQALCVTNGTTTLELALRALGVGPGDEVIVPSYTFAATALAVLTVGAVPVFVDSEPERLNVDPAAVDAAVGPHTVGVIPVHVGGHPVDFDALLSVAQRHGLFVLEDAAHAHGAEWRGRRVGALGHLGSFSFQTGKSLTSGDGGCLVSNDPHLADTCRSLRSFGRDVGGRHTLVGGNHRMTEFQAAVLQCQLARLDGQIERRQANLGRLTQRLEGLSGLRPAASDPRVTRQPHYISLLHVQPEAFSGISKSTLLAAMEAEGVPLEPGYTPLPRQPVFAQALAEGRARQHPCPVAEAASTSTLLWLSFRLLLASETQIDKAADALYRVHEARADLAQWERDVQGAARRPD